MTALDLARHYRAQGFAVIPIPVGKKAPEIVGWQHLVIADADLANYFNGKPSNMGLVLGEKSRGLVDVDLDASEARALADVFLPATAAIFGRASSARSHRLYLAEPVAKPERFEDPSAADGRSMLVEIRSTGQQTVVPNSRHPSGESVEWSAGASLEPARVAVDDLADAVRRLAGASLLVRYWPGEGARHHFAIALAGALIASEWTGADARTLIVAVAKAAGDDEAHDRALAVDTTLRRVAAQEPIVGIGGLRDQLPADVLRRVVDWLGLRVAPDHPYIERPDGLFLRTERGERRLTSFTARITEDVEDDDGVEVRHSFAITATVGGRSRTFTLPAAEFEAMKWPTERLGPEAVVFPGASVRDHARAAIQLLSGAPATRINYTHTGWRKVDGSWKYLHGAGAIGPGGSDDSISVRLPDRLAPFKLPAPPTGDDAVMAVEADLALLEVAPYSVTVPLLSAVYRAPLGGTDFALAVLGETGQGKSEITARMQQHYGAGFDRSRLPASFEDTANAIGALMFAAKDGLICVDDFAPSGSTGDVQRLNREAQRLIRTQGNGAGRLRMRADATLRESKDPRGLMVMTGEDAPAGQSIRARTLTVQLPKGGVNWDRMTAAQAAGAAGLYASAMAGFLTWIAADYEGWTAAVREAQRQQRASAEKIGNHRRTPDVLASLMAGFAIFTGYAEHVGALTAEARAELNKKAWEALTSDGAEQAAEQGEQDPVQRFVALLRASVASGDAHFAAASGDTPENPGAWGWHRKTYGGETSWQAPGRCVGWVDGDELFLEPEAAYEVARRAGSGLAVSSQTLHRRIAEAGLLRTVDEQRRRLTVRRTLAGARRYVLHIAAATVIEAESGPTGPVEVPARPTNLPGF